MQEQATGIYKLGMSCHLLRLICPENSNAQYKLWVMEARRLVEDLIVSRNMGRFIEDLMDATTHFEEAFKSGDIENRRKKL